MMFSNLKEYYEYIEFKNDSILIRKPYFSNGGCSLSRQRQTSNQPENIYGEYKYKRINDTLVISQFEESKDVKYKLTDSKYFENSERKEVYVMKNEFEAFPSVAISYKNEIYWVDLSQTSNRTIKKNGKINRMLTRGLKNKGDLSVIFYKKYEAFEEFGFNYVFGIIEVKDK